MPPFSSSSSPAHNFHKDNTIVKKVGPLDQDPATAEIIKNQEDKVKIQEEKIESLERDLSNLKSELYEMEEKARRTKGKVKNSDLYETSDGGHVASLPGGHPVIETIERNRIMEALTVGTRKLLETLEEEEKNRVAVDWSLPVAIDKAPQDVRELIAGTSNKVHRVSWETKKRDTKEDESVAQQDAEYVMAIFPDIFKDIKMIKQVNFCNEFDGEENEENYKYKGFSGVAVFYGEDLYLIMKNGKRCCLKNTNSFKTYPAITKNGPSFAGFGKTQEGRFILNNYVFSMADSSGGNVTNLKAGEFFTKERLQEVVDTGAMFNGIDPNTYYDKETQCIVMDKPEFARYYSKSNYGFEEAILVPKV